MEKLVILGGGVAGLSCLNALLDRGKSPLLLEASAIGSPKMCGEFLAPPAMPLLKQWDMGSIQDIKHACFVTNNHIVPFSFPRSAGACTRHHMEKALAMRALNKGGRIAEHTPIQSITPATHHTPHRVHLTSGTTIEAQHVIVATGKFSHTATQDNAVAYLGFKTHIPHVIQHQTLFMFGLKGGYLGIVPISDEKSNLTCLMKREEVTKAGGSCQSFLNHLRNHHQPLKPHLEQLDFDALHWLEGVAPAFGTKHRPNWPRTFWIGDALASFHPAIGYGFAHSIQSAIMAAEYYLQGEPLRYHQAMERRMRPKRLISKSLHRLLQNPRLSGSLAPIFGTNPWIRHLLFKKLDY